MTTKATTQPQAEELATITLHRDEDAPLCFAGELIAAASTSPDRARSDWSGATGRWTELELYRTRGGKYVVARVHRTQWQGERDTYEADAFDDLEGVADFLGWGIPARWLYEEIPGFDIVEHVD